MSVFRLIYVSFSRYFAWTQVQITIDLHNGKENKQNIFDTVVIPVWWKDENKRPNESTHETINQNHLFQKPSINDEKLESFFVKKDHFETTSIKIDLY